MSDTHGAAAPESSPPMTAEELAVIALGTPTPADPAAGTPTPQPEPDSGEPAAAAAPAPPDGSVQAPAPAPDGRNSVNRRIDQLVAEKHAARAAAQEAERRAALAEATLMELRQLAQTPPDGTPSEDPPSGRTYTQADLQREASRAAAEIEFNKACNAAVVKGREDFPDVFDKSLEALRSVTPVLPKMFVEAALETGAAPVVLHALGQNLAEYDRIISLPPLRQAVELTKLANSLVKPPEAAPIVPRAKPAAPAPISPRVGGGNGSVRTDVSPDDPKSDEIPSAEWFRRREAQIEAARKANTRRR